jgi:hypothetical protein
MVVFHVNLFASNARMKLFVPFVKQESFLETENVLIVIKVAVHVLMKVFAMNVKMDTF